MTPTPWAALLFVVVALIFVGLAVAMGYEAWAVGTNHETISSITAGAIKESPWKALIGVAVFFFLAGVLLSHFTNWSAN